MEAVYRGRAWSFLDILGGVLRLHYFLYTSRNINSAGLCVSMNVVVTIDPGIPGRMEMEADEQMLGAGGQFSLLVSTCKTSGKCRDSVDEYREYDTCLFQINE
jgi:hypothetical protein